MPLHILVCCLAVYFDIYSLALGEEQTLESCFDVFLRDKLHSLYLVLAKLKIVVSVQDCSPVFSCLICEFFILLFELVNEGRFCRVKFLLVRLPLEPLLQEVVDSVLEEGRRLFGGLDRYSE